MFALLGVPEISDDPEFRASFDVGNEKARRANREIIRTKIAEQVKSRERMNLFQTAMEWMVPIVLVATTQEILDSPQHAARGFFDEVEHPVIGNVTMPGAPFKMSESAWRSTIPAPLIGQHNAEIYGERLGYDVEELMDQGVI